MISNPTKGGARRKQKQTKIHAVPSPTSALQDRTETNRLPRLTDARVRQLVQAILPYDDDNSATALIELVTGVAYEIEAVDRDRLAWSATHEAYTLTMDFSEAVERFATRACRRKVAAHA
jgi:hypothetical protein